SATGAAVTGRTMGALCRVSMSRAYPARPYAHAYLSRACQSGAAPAGDGAGRDIEGEEVPVDVDLHAAVGRVHTALILVHAQVRPRGLGCRRRILVGAAVPVGDVDHVRFGDLPDVGHQVRDAAGFAAVCGRVIALQAQLGGPSRQEG